MANPTPEEDLLATQEAWEAWAPIDSDTRRFIDLPETSRYLGHVQGQAVYEETLTSGLKDLVPAADRLAWSTKSNLCSGTVRPHPPTQALLETYKRRWTVVTQAEALARDLVALHRTLYPEGPLSLPVEEDLDPRVYWAVGRCVPARPRPRNRYAQWRWEGFVPKGWPAFAASNQRMTWETQAQWLAYEVSVIRYMATPSPAVERTFALLREIHKLGVDVWSYQPLVLLLHPEN